MLNNNEVHESLKKKKKNLLKRTKSVMKVKRRWSGKSVLRRKHWNIGLNGERKNSQVCLQTGNRRRLFPREGM